MLRFAYSEILGTFHHSRQLSVADVQFLLKSNAWKERPTDPDWIQKDNISSLEFNRFFEWYIPLLKCLLASELWMFEDCIRGFVNKTNMIKLLSTLPRIEESKVL
jgi:hypothetical protein